MIEIRRMIRRILSKKIFTTLKSVKRKKYIFFPLLFSAFLKLVSKRELNNALCSAGRLFEISLTRHRRELWFFALAPCHRIMWAIVI